MEQTNNSNNSNNNNNNNHIPSVQELNSHRQQLEKEIEVLNASMIKLKEVQEVFIQNISSLVTLGSCSLEQEALIPLTNSVYTVGKIQDRESVIVDIGTGYFMEKTLKEADDYYVRKVKFLQDQLTTLGGLLGQRRNDHQLLAKAIILKSNEVTAQ